MDLDLKQFLHRGAQLKNSNYIDAIVLYTGAHTKLVLNQGKYEFKMSQLDRSINIITVFNIGIIASMCSLVTILNVDFINKYNLPSLDGKP